MQTVISKLVNQKRQSLGLTIERLAERAGVSISLISRIERGEIDNISLKKLQAIADALGLEMSDFFGEEALTGVHTVALIAYLKSLPEAKRETVAESILRILKL
ncbi:helix-turn-helix domain-containing protein [Secundilactobacillus kimchicus]|uniref:helix-turn-helix domain-containing protein n=1 Tax=Secundilactobacillus kimchicus TaxID=528209 RepID=UPI001C0302D6|nr:helix-turn-helix transcriptional regulator [Secundilactobacillus kimchicus]MBT9672614.1 helix-turn-helix domain-containing protein [Secundilactobacillus kimchicus]